MRAGVIGRVTGEFARVEPFQQTERRDGFELTSQVEVTSVQRTPGGLDITVGRAAAQRVRERESVALGGGSISVATEPEVTTSYTEFLTVPGEFVVVRSSGGAFAFDLLADHTGTEIERATVDLDGFVAAFPDATPWKVGFYDHSGTAENGVIHGESVLEDAVFGGALAESKKNQLGLILEHAGREHKMAVTRSGYVDVYQPANIELAEFATFVREEVLPHTD